MENEEIKTPIFDLASFKEKTNYVLEASAGTGKTYNITEIIKKLLVNYKVGLDKILIVTYTDKAAGELKNRIREILTTPSKDYGGLSIKEYLGDTVNTDIDNASIGTIHSFCKKTIDEFAFSINQPHNLELCDDNSTMDFANCFIREGEILNDISKLLLIDYDIDGDKLANTFSLLMKSYYLDKSFNEDSSIISHKFCSSDEPTLTFLTKLFIPNNVEKAIKEYNSDLYKDYLFIKQSDDPVLMDFFALLNNFKEFCKDPRTKTNFNIAKKNNYTDKEVESFKALFNLKSTYNDFNPFHYLADKYIKDFYISYQIYKQENRLQSFNDMIREIRESILSENSELLACLRNKYSYGIIDEFQDTNQIQFDIFSKMFLCDNHNIIVVGDPKQSIYSFQGADVLVYKSACEIIAKNGLKCRLAKNYRSAPGVVEFGNELFKCFWSDGSFEPSSYCLLTNNEKERRIKFKGKYTSSLWINENELNEDQFAKFAVEQLLECVSKDKNNKTNLQLSYIHSGEIKYRDVSFSDFAVLARTRSEMKSIEQAFKKTGIPFVRYKDTSLFTSIACAEWIAILEAINVTDFTGYNRGYFKKALFTKFFDFSLNEISKQIYDSDDSPQIELFSKWRNLAKQKLWQDLFDEIMVDTNLNDHLSSISNFQTLSLYKQLADYAIDYLSNNKNLIELIKHLRTINKFVDSDEASEDSSLVAKSSDFNSVTIMTMHASKGLQFPVVISVGGFKGPAKSSPYTYHETSENGDVHRFVSFDKGETCDKEQTEEFYRLFYVAFTRPEFLLIAPLYKDARLGCIDYMMDKFVENYEEKTFTFDNENIPYFIRKPFYDSSFTSLKHKTQLVLISNDEVDQTSEKEEQLQVLKKLIKTKNSKRTFKHSYSSLVHHSNESNNEIIDDDEYIDKEGNSEIQPIIYDLSAKQIIGKYDNNLSPLIVPDGYPRGSLMGNSIHEVFERLDFTNYEEYLEKLIIDRFNINGCSLNDNEEWIKYTSNMVNSVLNANLSIVKGSKEVQGSFKLKDITIDNKKAEIEFNFNYPNERLKNYLNGFIDLLFKRGDVYSILDWKSDTLNDDFLSYSDPSELKKHVDERYSIQRVLYSYCLIKWLKQYYEESLEDIFKNHFGGIYYVFVRGCNNDTCNGIYVQTWASFSDLENEFNKIIWGKEN